MHWTVVGAGDSSLNSRLYIHLQWHSIPDAQCQETVTNSGPALTRGTKERSRTLSEPSLSSEKWRNSQRAYKRGRTGTGALLPTSSAVRTHLGHVRVQKSMCVKSYEVLSGIPGVNNEFNVFLTQMHSLREFPCVRHRMKPRVTPCLAVLSAHQTENYPV